KDISGTMSNFGYTHESTDVYMGAGGSNSDHDILGVYIRMPTEDVVVGSYPTSSNRNSLQYTDEYAPNSSVSYIAKGTDPNAQITFDVISREATPYGFKFTASFSGSMVQRFGSTSTPHPISDGSLIC